MTGEVACVGVVTVDLRRKEMFERRFNGDARANGRETRQRDIVVKMLARDRGSRNAQSQGCSPEKPLTKSSRPNLKSPGCQAAKYLLINPLNIIKRIL